MCGWQVKLCDPLVTHGPYLSALEVQHDEALYKSHLLSHRVRVRVRTAGRAWHAVRAIS